MRHPPLVQSALNEPTLDHSTLGQNGLEPGPLHPRAWSLTILYHPVLERLGARYGWPAVTGQGLDLSRVTPAFQEPDGETTAPLLEPHLSRSALTLLTVPGGLELRAENDRVQFDVGGRPASGVERLDHACLSRGVVITLGGTVSLLLRGEDGLGERGADLGIVGVSSAMARLRDQLERLAGLDQPLLISGESGVGKELVAQAVHRISPRRDHRMVTVNMAALPSATAAAQLFGHSRGAYTGASEARAGFFREAEGGTLFLDEVGETPPEIQSMLLRAIETQEIQPIGQPSRRIDVRIITATDSDLSRRCRAGTFSLPLLYRLTATSVHVPPLRDRREDIPLLLLTLLRQALLELGCPDRLRSNLEAGPPWLRRQDMLTMVAHAWPGNVRQLRNVAYQLASQGCTASVAELPAWLLEGDLNWDAPPGHPLGNQAPRSHTEALGQDARREASREGLPGLAGEDGPARGAAAVDVPALSRKDRPDALSLRPRELNAEHLRQGLEQHDWQIGPTAAFLGISRNSLYSLMSQFGFPVAGRLSREDILTARLEADTGSLEDLARLLKVSPRGLLARMRSLGLDP